MSSRNARNTSNWQARVHQVEFTNPQLDQIKEMDQRNEMSLHAVLENLVVDNASVKVKHSEYADAYTFSYTLDKNHPNFPSHTWWFYDTDLGRGIRVLAIFVEQILPDWTDTPIKSTDNGLW